MQSGKGYRDNFVIYFPSELPLDRNMTQPLNILFLLSDQQRHDTLGVVNPAIQTPHLDRLAREGVRADATYSPTPVCLPCRCSMVTGQFPSTHGATCNTSHLPTDYPYQVAAVLRERGYRTHMIGKSHLNNCHDPASPEAPPHIHDRDHFRQWNGPWYGFEHASLNIGHSTEPHACGMHYGVWLEDRGIDTDHYFGKTAYTDYGAWDLPAECHNSAWIAEEVIESMKKSRAEGQPFYIWGNFQDPHNPCMVPEPWASMYDPEKVPFRGLTDQDRAALADKPSFYREILEQTGSYSAQPSDPELPGAGDICSLSWDERKARENVAAYYGMVSLMDHHIGRILHYLDESGLAENTLVVFSSDHGDCLGDHGYWFKSLVTYDESMRLPFLARLPGRIPAATVTATPQNLLDVFPSMFSLAGLPQPWFFEGTDRSAHWQGKAGDEDDEFTVVEERPYATAWNKRVMVTRQYVLAYYAGRSEGELYRRQTDPHHEKNLWSDPASREIRDQLIRRLLDREMNKVGVRATPSKHQG